MARIMFQGYCVDPSIARLWVIPYRLVGIRAAMSPPPMTPAVIDIVRAAQAVYCCPVGDEKRANFG